MYAYSKETGFLTTTRQTSFTSLPTRLMITHLQNSHTVAGVLPGIATGDVFYFSVFIGLAVSQCVPIDDESLHRIDSIVQP